VQLFYRLLRKSIFAVLLDDLIQKIQRRLMAFGLENILYGASLEGQALLNDPIGLLEGERVALDGVRVVGHLHLEALAELLHHGFRKRA